MQERLEAFKLEALEERHEFERFLGFYEELQQYIEELARVLAGSLKADDLREAQLSVQNQFNDQEYRFIEWHEGEQTINDAVHTLIHEPGLYRGRADVFKAHIQEVTARCEYHVRKQLQTLYELNDKIAALSDDTTAQKLTRTEPAERPKLSERLKQADALAETVIKWGDRVIRLNVAARIFDMLKNVGG